MPSMPFLIGYIRERWDKKSKARPRSSPNEGDPSSRQETNVQLLFNVAAFRTQVSQVQFHIRLIKATRDYT